MAEVWLITGAAGFIGSNVAKHLLNKGHTVIGLDNLSSGDVSNVESFYDLPYWHWVLGDITDPVVEDIFKNYKITHVLHLAAMVSVQACEQSPGEAKRVNEYGFERILQLSLGHQVLQLIYASSSAVYGAAAHMPIAETAPLKPLSLYGKTKVHNEQMAAHLCQDKKISCIGMRFFNIFGPHQGMHGGYAAVIPKWSHVIRAKQTPIIFGDGLATRDFCSIENVLLALDKAVELALQGHHVYNIGNGEATTLNQLYETMCDILGHHPKPQHLPWRPDDIVHSCADITLAKTALDYRPEVSLEEGLRKMFTPSSRLL